MRIIKPAKLTEKQLEDMNTLIELCNKHDGLKCSVDVDEAFKTPDDINTFLLYDENKLLSYIDLFTPTKPEAEVTAFTHPEHRQQGLFTKLLKEAQTEIGLREIKDFLFVCDKKSKEGQAVISHLGAVYDFSEYLMIHDRNIGLKAQTDPQLFIRESVPDDTEKLIHLSRLAFDESEKDAQNYIKHIFTSSNRTQHIAVIDDRFGGMISTAIEGEKSYIHGLGVSPEYRKQGIGSALLAYKVAESLKLFPDYAIELEVMTGNSGALSIYKRAGFEVKACYDYFRIAAVDI